MYLMSLIGDPFSVIKSIRSLHFLLPFSFSGVCSNCRFCFCVIRFEETRVVRGRWNPKPGVRPVDYSNRIDEHCVGALEPVNARFKEGGELVGCLRFRHFQTAELNFPAVQVVFVRLCEGEERKRETYLRMGRKQPLHPNNLDRSF